MIQIARVLYLACSRAVVQQDCDSLHSIMRYYIVQAKSRTMELIGMMHGSASAPDLLMMASQASDGETDAC